MLLIFKNWLDNILSGLAARHLKPPMQQVKMLVQNEATLTRLKKATELKQQLDIICGAAYRAQLGWQKVSSDSTGSSTSGAQSSNNTPVGPPPEPKVQSWRLRPRDWQSAKPASAAEPITGDRQDVFRTNVEGDPLLQVWSRVCGAYFVDQSEAVRIIRSIPAHMPPAGLFTLVTVEPTCRSVPVAVETVVLFPDGSPHLKKVYLSHLGTDTLSPVSWKSVSLASVENVDLLLEWWKDLSVGRDLEKFHEFHRAAEELGNPNPKGSGKAKGKQKGSGSGKMSDSLAARISQHIKSMPPDSVGKMFDSLKRSNHNVKSDIIRVSIRLPKSDAVTWLVKGVSHDALLVRDLTDFPEAQDLRKVWVNEGCPILDGDSISIRQSLSLYLADFKSGWSVVRTPYRWGVRVDKSHECEVMSILQPRFVYVPEGHSKYRIDNIPKGVDAEALVKTLTSDNFQPYLVSVHGSKLVIAAPSAPPDIVFVIKEIQTTLLLQPVPQVPRSSSGAGGVSNSALRHLEDTSPKRKTAKPNEDTKGGGLLSNNRFELLGADDVEFPALPSKSVLHPPHTKPDCLPNHGNTCFVAAAVRCLAHMVKHSSVASADVHEPSLRQLLSDLCPFAWTRFLSAHGLTPTKQKDSVLFFQKLLDTEPALASLVQLEEHIAVECTGCQESKTLNVSSHVISLPAPETDPCTLQDLLAQHFWTSNSELELSCELCFSEHKTPQSKVVQHKDWLLLQVLRAGADDSKKVTPVEVCPSLDFADHCWDMQRGVSFRFHSVSRSLHCVEAFGV